MPSRRYALTMLLALGATPLAASSTRVRRIGLLTAATTPNQREEDLRQGLRALGWREGENLSIDYRRAGNSPQRLAEMAAALVAANVEVIVASTTTAVIAAREASRSVPIVAISADPIGNGLAASLARPGGNITGISTISPGLSAKRLELLRELSPALRRVAFLGYAPDPTHRHFLAGLEAAGPALGLSVVPLLIEAAADLPSAFLQLRRERFDALAVQPLLPIMGMGQAIAEFALRERLPSISDSLSFVGAGGLMSYGYDPAFADRRLAIYVDRILKGADPATLPIETPQKFLLALNQTTAQRLGLKLVPALRLRVDRFIE